MQPLRIVIAEDEPTTLMTLGLYFSKAPEFELVATATNGESAVNTALDFKPDVLLCDIAMPRKDGIQVADAVSQALPDCIVVILSSQDSNEYAKLAIEAGARDYIHKSVDMASVPHRVFEVVRRVRLIEHSAQQRRAEQEAVSKIYAFYSPTGVAGSSTLAVNAALELTRNQQKTLLLDLNLQFGDVEFLLDLKGRVSISSIVDGMGDLLDYKLAGIAERHKSGLKVLYQHSLRDSELVTAKVVVSLLKSAREHMGVDFVLLDLDGRIDERTLSALDFADALFVVVSEDMLSVRKCKRALDVFRDLGLSDKIKLLVNKVTGKPAPHVAEILGPTFASIPVDPELFEDSARSGFPPIIENPSAPFSRAIADLVASAILLRKPAPSVESADSGVGRVGKLFKKLFS